MQIHRKVKYIEIRNENRNLFSEAFLATTIETNNKLLKTSCSDYRNVQQIRTIC